MARDITTQSFGGSIPRRADHLTPLGQATRALDCRLENGELASWRTPRLVRTFDAAVHSVYHAFNCCWLESTQCAHWAEGSTEQRHVFVTGYNDYAYPVRLVLNDDCVPTVVRLGLPCPADRLATNQNTSTAGKIAESSKGASPRSYAYQYADRYSNLSSLSEPSLDIVVNDGEAVQVSGWTIPAGNWDIQTIYLYRSVAGFESATQEGANSIDASWMLVAIIPANQVSFVDAIADIELDEALKEDVVEPPPATLKGLTWIRSMNCLAGYDGRKLYFTENNNYHNWAYSLLLDDDIKAIVESNDIVYVATNGAPYVVPGASDCASAGCRRAVRMPESLPLVGGGFRSLVAIPSGAVYPTHQGLVHLSGNRAPVIASTAMYGQVEWQNLHPDTIRACYFEGRLFCFFRRGGFCLAIRDGAGTGADLDQHTELSIRPEELFVSRTGRFYMRVGNELFEWDRGADYMVHTYTGPLHEIGLPMNFGVLQVMMKPGNERVTLTVDGEVAVDDPFTGDDVFLLPQWATGQRFQWTLTGTSRVSRIGLAPSNKELA